MSMALAACKGEKKTDDKKDVEKAVVVSDTTDIPTKEITVGTKTYLVADINDSAKVYKEATDPRRCFFVISKKEYRLYVYEITPDGKDTALVAHFPVCYGKNPADKQKSGDMATPECTPDSAFKLTEIKDASTWEHDFGDGRGPIAAYGNFFLRLETPGFTGVGIHGSTNNEPSVPGRDSEGCIRLRDKDLDLLRARFAFISQKVIIKGINQGKLPFEMKAQQALGNLYQAPKAGYVMPETTAMASNNVIGEKPSKEEIERRNIKVKVPPMHKQDIILKEDNNNKH